jgi:O-methyltransferase involved in polyketide biosynthesis
VKRDFPGRILFEMAGLLDYFDDTKAERFFAQLAEWMRPGDVFCVSNVVPNRERPFVEKVVRWRGMYYRSPGVLRNLLTAGGFLPNEIEMVQDATGVHSIATVTKECARGAGTNMHVRSVQGEFYYQGAHVE